MNLRRILIATFLAFMLSAMLAGFRKSTVDALVPTIVSVTSYDDGLDAWVNITINHSPPPDIGPSHYVSNVELEINGTSQNLPQTPQTTMTFSVQQRLGSLNNTYVVRARAQCILHGYSDWSTQATIPEYTIPVIALFLAYAAIIIFIAKLPLRSDAED